MSKSYCMKCKKEAGEDVKMCDCGSRFFAFGDNFHFNENGIVCDCGSDKFKATIHMDSAEKGVNNYSCTKCGNPVGTESYRSEEDMYFFMDDEE